MSVEHAWRCLITVCFGLKLLIVNHLKGQLDPACLRSSGEKRSTPSPEAVLLLPWGASPAPREGVFSQLCLVLIRNLWQEMCSCFVTETPAYGGWMATSRAGLTAQHGAGGFSLSLRAAGSQAAPILAHRRQLAQRSQRFLCFNNSFSLMVGLD